MVLLAHFITISPKFINIQTGKESIYSAESSH